MNEFFLGAYWDVREESIDACADRLQQLFDSLVNSDSLMRCWFALQNAPKHAAQQLSGSGRRAKILHALDRGRHRNAYKQIMPDMGFTTGFWNGGTRGEEIRMTLTCGCYADFMTFPNNLVINFPRALGGPTASKCMADVLESVASIWEPAWAGVISDGAREARNFRAAIPFLDWMLYLSRDRLPIPPTLWPPAHAKSMSRGTLVVTQDEPPDWRNPEHVQNIRRVESAIFQSTTGQEMRS